MTKPTSNALWDTNDTNSTDPGATKHANGYADNAVLPAAEFNWMLQAHGDWIAWLERKQAQATLSEGIEDNDAGDTFTLAQTQRVAWSSTQLLSDTRSGAAGERLLATDGVYYAWQPEDEEGFYLARIDGTGTPVAVTGLAPLVALAIDGQRVWLLTSDDDLLVYDYAGSQISNVTLTSPDPILAVGRDKIAIVRGRYVSLYDEDSNELATWDAGAGAAGKAVMFVPGSPGDTNDYVQVAWLEPALNKLQLDGLVYSSPSLTSQWSYNVNVAPSAVLAMHWQGLVGRLVMTATTDFLVTWPLTAGFVPATHVAVDLGVAHGRLCATPIGLVAVDGTDLYIYDYEGDRLLTADSTGTLYAESTLYGLVCDGADLLLVYDTGSADRIYQAFLGHAAALVRVYDASDAHPVCVSRGVMA